jgi:MFS family permease
VWAPERRALTVGLLLTITLVALEALAVATIMPQVRADLGGYALYGWVFSGFFLASIVGIVAGGRAADRQGVAPPFLAGVVLFAGGLVVAGLAGSMAVLVAGRLLQGLGAGLVPAVAYAAIARTYPASVRPRMFALLSTAWVVPGLLGPAAAAAVEHTFGWRWVFLGLLPVVALAAAIAVPALAGVAPVAPVEPSSASRAADRARTARVATLVAGVGAVMAAPTGVPVALAVVLVAAGLPLAVWAFLGLVPPGTGRLAPGVPATVAVRGLLTWSFFSGDAYLSLTVIDGRGGSVFLAGAALSAASVLWAAGSWIQAAHVERIGPRRLVGSGLVCVAVGVLLALGVALGLPVGLMIPAWAVAGLGIGLAYAPLSLVVLASAAPHEVGAASASLHLSDTLGIAVGTGIGGGVIALGDAAGWTVSAAAAVVFAHALVMSGVALAASRRLPRQVPGVATPAGPPLPG